MFARQTVALIAVIVALFVACEPPTREILAHNLTATAVSLQAEFDTDSLPLGGTIAPGEKGTVVFMMGRGDDHRLFLGADCTIAPVVAYDDAGREVARHPPGLCFGETWVIADTSPVSPT